MDAISGLLAALEVSPDNHAVRALLVDHLRETSPDEALTHIEKLVDVASGAQAVSWANLAADQDAWGLVDRLVQRAHRVGQVDGVRALEQRRQASRASQGVATLTLVQGGDDAVGTSRITPEDTVSFDDIGGMKDLKKVVHRRVILPLQRPGLFSKYRRKAGGGVLLYGPPGCGKTLLARATAGECDLPFFNVRIEDILSPYIGVSEQNLAAIFETARANAPCVVFLDELDAIGFARNRMQGEHRRGLVDQLLQELDGMDKGNAGVLVLAATNAPWDVDDALQRPGRFDRLVFVPPPDEEARAEILEVHLRDRPRQDLDLAAVARQTDRFSGADLADLVERAVDAVIEEALETGAEPPIGQQHVMAALREQRPSTLDWLQRAQNYVEFANRDGKYADVETYLKGRSTGWRLFRR